MNLRERLHLSEPQQSRATSAKAAGGGTRPGRLGNQGFVLQVTCQKPPFSQLKCRPLLRGNRTARKMSSCHPKIVPRCYPWKRKLTGNPRECSGHPRDAVAGAPPRNAGRAARRRRRLLSLHSRGQNMRESQGASPLTLTSPLSSLSLSSPHPGVAINPSRTNER